ncbi:hypothetical protein [Sandaracinus amylolyticus]|uniref:hypothetical protein n=1 Tax=Sandaracinus amylolyticus TaxID=927083 RepID=UPI001F2D1240|nr:hypothetical protein [Sandaracinus amylolyticus]
MADGTDVRSYTDSAGRSCTVDRFDISYTATCDADPTSVVTCTDSPSCATVDCETDLDCLHDRYACTGGVCRDMTN